MYTAIMKAADQIERHPELFNFVTTDYPSCNTPGCAIGWIAMFTKGWEADKHGSWSYNDTKCQEMLGIDSGEFYPRMDDLLDTDGWEESPSLCATGMRLYAEKYHGHEKPKGIPESVRAIFDVEVTVNE